MVKQPFLDNRGALSALLLCQTDELPEQGAPLQSVALNL